MSRHRNWCFTLNNWIEDEFEKIKKWIIKYCKYGIIGREIGEQGTPHLQGYFQRNNPGSLSGLKTQVSPRAHFEIARGTPSQNYEYCTKEDGTPWEHGTLEDQSQGREMI